MNGEVCEAKLKQTLRLKAKTNKKEKWRINWP